MAKLALFLDPLGRPLRGATVEVFRVGTQRRATLYSNRIMTVEADNPLTTDSQGNAEAFLPSGSLVDIRIEHPSYGQLWRPRTEILGSDAFAPELLSSPGFESAGGWSFVNGANRSNIGERSGDWCADVRVTFTFPSGPWVYEKITQTVSDFEIGRNYQLSGWIWQPVGESCDLTLDGATLGTCTSTVDAYELCEATFVATATTHVVGFEPNGGPGVGSTLALIDDCSLREVA